MHEPTITLEYKTLGKLPEKRAVKLHYDAQTAWFGFESWPFLIHVSKRSAVQFARALLALCGEK